MTCATLSNAMWGDKKGDSRPSRGPPVTDGILTVTPDTPEILDWRARSALDVAETSSTYLDDDEDDGPKPHELYGKFTWKISNFSDISKRELRSTTFDVGGYKWYILVYPQGCDVCNHLSLFLCVADYDKLLPGWSHFAQFTIAVVNKDPKKSKYSDTLHRFCKKEHDWGWKKFMELSKVLDGFTVADTLVIKAQVQVILDKPGKPFRCLDPQYRRELVRVYLTNVEGVCRRFCDEKRARLVWAKDEALKFRDVWRQLSSEDQRRLLSEKADVILKGVVKQFFNEKEVTSTLVMDALYSGCKQIDEHSRMYLEGTTQEEPPVVLVRAERNVFMLNGDIMEIADRATKDFIPISKDESKMMQPNDGLSLRSGQDDDYRRDTIERDEKRLAELGRKTVEMFVISQVFTERLEVAYREAEALKRQDQLIAEELALQQLEDIKRREQAEREREKRSKKKERMKLKKEAERVKKDAEDAERRTHEALKRKEQERKVAEAAVAEKKRQNEASRSPPPHATKQHQGSQPTAGARPMQEDAPSSIPHQQPPQPSPARGKHIQQQAKQQQQQQQPSLSITSPSHAKSRGPSASPANANHCQPSSISGPLPSPAASSQQPPLSRPLHMPYSSISRSSRRRGGSRGAEDLALGSSASSSQDRAELEESEDGGAGALKQQAQGPETDSVSDRSDELELELLRTQVHQLQLLLAERDAEILALHAQLNELQPLAASATSLQAALAATTSAAALADGSPTLVSRSSGGIPFASVEPVESAPSTRGMGSSSSSGAGPGSGPPATSAWGGSGHKVGAPGRPSPPHQHQPQHKGGLANGTAARQQQHQSQQAATSLPHVGSRDGELTRTGSTSSLASSVASEVVAPLASSSSSGGAAVGAAKVAAAATANGFAHPHPHHPPHHRAAGEPASSSSSQTQLQGGATTRKAAAGSEAGLPSGVPGAAFDSPPSTSGSSTAASSHPLVASPAHLSSHTRTNGPCVGQPPLSPAQPSHRNAGTSHQQQAAAAAARMQRGETTTTAAPALLAGKPVVVPPPPPPPSTRPSPAASFATPSAAPPTAAQVLFPSVSSSSCSGGGGGGGRLRTPSVTGQQALASTTAAGPAPEPPSTSGTSAATKAGVPVHPLTAVPATAAGPATPTGITDPPAAPSYRNAAAGVISGAGPTGAATATTSAAAASQKQHAAAAAPGPPSSSTAAIPAATPAATSNAAATAAAAAATSKPLNASATEFTGQRLMLSPADTAAAAAAAASTSAAAAASGVPTSAAVPVTAAAVAAAAAAAASEEQEGSDTPVQQARLASQLPADSPGLDDFAHMGLIDDLLGAE